MNNIKEFLNWKNNLYQNEEIEKLVDDTSNKLLDILGEPDLELEDAFDIYMLKSDALWERFEGSLRYSFWSSSQIFYIDKENLPDPADIEEDESEHDNCFMYDLAESLDNEFENTNRETLYKIIGYIYYGHNRERIRSDESRNREEVLSEIKDFIKNIGK